MNEDNGIWGYVIAGAIVWGIFSFFSGDKTDSYVSPSYNAPSYNSTYSDYDDYYEEPVEPENPYDYDTGHYAGYEWAEETGGDCDGNSDSFNEGCEEYYAQEETYEEAIDY